MLSLFNISIIIVAVLCHCGCCYSAWLFTCCCYVHSCSYITYVCCSLVGLELPVICCSSFDISVTTDRLQNFSSQLEVPRCAIIIMKSFSVWERLSKKNVAPKIQMFGRGFVFSLPFCRFERQKLCLRQKGKRKEKEHGQTKIGRAFFGGRKCISPIKAHFS